MIPDPNGQLAELIVYITSTRVDLYSHQILLTAYHIMRPHSSKIRDIIYSMDLCHYGSAIRSSKVFRWWQSNAENIFNIFIEFFLFEPSPRFYRRGGSKETYDSDKIVYTVYPARTRAGNRITFTVIWSPFHKLYKFRLTVVVTSNNVNFI